MSDPDEDNMLSLDAVTEDIPLVFVERSGAHDQPRDLLHISPPSLDIDENTHMNVHSTLYNVLQLNNLHRFEEWLCEFNDSDTLLKISSVLPEVYEELKLRHVFLTRELEYFVEHKLISLYFNCEENKFVNKRVSDISLDDVNGRIKMTVDLADELISNYIGEKKSIGQEFVLISRFVCQNIHTLKRQLRSSYNKLPWEEMEFCLVTFISMYTKPLEYNIAYKLVLNTERVLNHLTNFVRQLSEEKFEKGDVNSEFPKQAYPELSTRCSAVKSVVDKCGKFKELYDDYNEIINVYSLKRIESAIKLALSIDLGKEKERGKLVIERTLHMIGESLKNTLQSPNVTDDIHKTLLTAAPRNLRENITVLRDSLSHAHTLRRKVELEESEDFEFFYEVQNDLKKIETEIGVILYEKKMVSITKFLKRVVDCKTVVELNKLTGCLTVFEPGEINRENMKTRELININKWVKALLKLLKLCSAEGKLFFKEINKVVHSEEMRLENSKHYYFTELSKLDYLSSQLLESDSLETIQNKARSHLNGIIMELEIKPSMFAKIVTLIDEFMQSCDWSAQYRVDEVHKINYLVSQIRAAVSFGVGRINGIDRFKDGLGKKVNDPLSKATDEINKMFSQIDVILTSKEDRSKVEQELLKKRQIYEAKSDLYQLFSSLVTGSVTIEDSDIKERYYTKARLVETKKSVLDGKFENYEWDSCKTLVNNIRSSYQTLLHSVKNAIEDEKRYDTYKAFKEFFKSFKDTGLKKKLNEAIEKISLDSKEQNKKYFLNRLEILTRLLPVSGGDHFTIVAKYLEDRALQAAVEMLVLDLVEVMNEKSLLADDRLFFDGYSPILMGLTLRNYLAHGDALVDILPCDPAVAIVSVALKFIQDGRQLVGSTTKSQLIGRHITSDLGSLKIRYSRNSKVVRSQVEMFTGATQGHIDKVRNSIDMGADIKGRDNKGWTALCFAVHGNSLQSVKFFLEQELNIGIKDIYGRTLLHIAATSKSNNVITYLTEKMRSNINDMDHRGLTPLHYSSLNGCQDVVEVLVEQGADVGVTDNNNVTPLHLAAGSGHIGVVRVLLDKKANAQALAKDNLTPLHAAAMTGHEDVVEVLLPWTTEVDICSDTNNTPLVHAACNGHTAVVKVLLANNADVNACNDDRLTALHLASRSGNVDVVCSLLERGAQVDAVSEDCNWTALHYAAVKGHARVVAALLKRDAAVDARTDANCTALHLADEWDVVRALVGGGAEVNATGRSDWTPLHFAAYRRRPEAVSALLASGAQVEARCEPLNRTPLHLACQGGAGDVAELLVAAGGRMDARDAPGMTPLHDLAAFGHAAALERLLPEIPEVDVRNGGEQTPLHMAAGRGHARAVAALLRAGAEVDALTRGKWTPLHFAAGNGHAETVHLLLAHGADLDAATADAVTPLHLAAMAHEGVARALLRRGAAVHAVTVHKWTPLHYAALNGRREIARALLERGADVDAEDEHRNTPLHFAAQCDYKDVVEVLVRYKAKLNALSADRHTPLFNAVLLNHTDTVRLLVEKGADINARIALTLRTALHTAAHEGYRDAAAALLAGGADPNLGDKNKETPLHLAIRRGHSQVVELLLDHDAAVDIPNKHGWTALHYAADQGHNGIVLSLINREVDVDVRDDEGMTPLHCAALKGHSIVVETLLSKNATVDARTGYNHTPLHYAATKGHVSVVNALLDRDAQVDARNANDETPLHFAACIAHLDVVKALLLKGADVLAASGRRSVLHGAVIADDVDIVRFILGKIRESVDCDDSLEMCHHINAADRDGDSPLMCAVMVANVDILRLLLECGADVDIQNNSGMTALYMATQDGNSELVKTLIDWNANANIKGPGGKTPQDVAIEQGHSKIKAMLKSDVSGTWNVLKTHWQSFCAVVGRALRQRSY